MRALRFLRFLDDEQPWLSLTHLAVWLSMALLAFTVIHTGTMSIPEVITFLAAVALYDRKKIHKARAAEAAATTQDTDAQRTLAQGAVDAVKAFAAEVPAIKEKLTQLDNRTQKAASLPLPPGLRR